MNCVFAVQQLSAKRLKIDFSDLSRTTLELLHAKEDVQSKRWSGDRELITGPTPPLQYDFVRTPSPTVDTTASLSLKSTAVKQSSTKQRSTSPNNKRSGSPIPRSRAASPTRNHLGPSLNNPVWLPHMKPSKPVPRSALKKSGAEYDGTAGENTANGSTAAIMNASKEDTMLAFKPIKPAPKSAGKAHVGVAGILSGIAEL